MDPTATCKLLISAIARNEHDTIAELCEALTGWICNGGFMPAQGYLEEVLENLADTGEDWAEHPEIVFFMEHAPDWAGLS